MSRRILASLALIALTVLFAPAVPAAAQVDEGKAIFEDNCVPCHGEDLSGGVGLPLNAGSDAANKTDEELTSIITNGVSGTAMPAWGSSSAPTQLSQDEIAQVLSYIRAVQNGTIAPPTPVEPQGPTTHFPWGLVFIVSAAVALSAGLIVMVVNPGQSTFTWRQAFVRGFVIFFYFFLLTVWMPSMMFTEPPMTSAPSLVQDIVISGAWITMLAIGIGSLRYLQKARRI
jgi:mono/diheme cytochrome c family protein